ncbi:MAG: GNAT family N-acetyltransferase [Nocardioides sp.]
MSDWRRATPGDAGLLADLERDANLVALAHLFPPARHPFPYDGVLERWRAVLADDVVVEVVEGTDGLDAFVAYDATVLRHLAVRPARWGRGLAGEAVARARAAGARRLWCLAGNHHARSVYDHLGWRPTGLTRAAEWSPYPIEIEYRSDEPGGALTASQG